jgi:Esterase-like activity of phytase
MNALLNRVVSVALGSLLSALVVGRAVAEITFLGVGQVPGDATDLSGLTGNYADDPQFPKNRLGAFGSAIAYTGTGNLYVMSNDRGYADGTVDYNDRVQYFQIGVQLNAGNPNQATITPQLVDTKLLYNSSGVNYTGFSGAFNPSTYPAGALRLDPEGLRVGFNGQLYISDEYGPYVYQFDRNGHQTGTIAVPIKYSITNPSASGDAELQNNVIGRQTNRGMEGLAISPDGRYLFGMMQNALIQDHALNASFGRVGLNNRILKVDLQTGQTSE